jgi:uncharacterized phiE125 gp8 family phage protein
VSLTLVTPPGSEPVTLSQARDQVLVTDSAHDGYLADLIVYAREAAERHTGRRLISQIWTLSRDAWPADGIVRMPLPPLVVVSEIRYLDTEGELRVLSPEQYQVHVASGRVAPAPDSEWPEISDQHLGAVEIDFVAGYGATGDAVPMPIRRAILVEIGNHFAHRESVIVGTNTAEIQTMAARLLLGPYRVNWVL